MRIKLSEEHFDWTEVRRERNRLLERTDRYVLPDFPISEEDRAEVVSYRAALRGALNGVRRPCDVALPTPPTCLEGKLK